LAISKLTTQLEGKKISRLWRN